MTARPSTLPPDELRRLHVQRKSAIRKRLREFSLVPQEEYFYELAYCLLTPQSSARNAGAVIDTLRRRNFRELPFDATSILRDRRHYIRFHATKARRLLELQTIYPEIDRRLSPRGDGRQLREWLVEHVNGLGWKEASHFLRNIGYRDLAILDRHILRNLQRLGVLKRLPPTLTPKRYLRIERQFRSFCDACGIPLDEMDLLFWSRETGVILK